MYDVLVVGGGLTGCLAALTAAAAGARVGLAQGGWGATAQAHGALELVRWRGEAADAGTDQHLASLCRGAADHPLARLGPERASAAMVVAMQQLSRVLSPASLAPSAWTPTAAAQHYADAGGDGLVAATAFAPHVALPTSGVWGVLGPAPPATGADWRPLALPAGLRGAAVAVAQALDGEAARALLAAELRPACAGLTGLLVPPLLGLAQPQVVRAELAAALGLPVQELLAAAVPSLPGLRLMQALQAALQAAGVQPLGRVLAATCVAGRLASLSIAGASEPVRLGAAVLASGRFLGGGLVLRGGLPHESLLDLPLDFIPEVEEVSLGAVPWARQPLLEAGVVVNTDLQPVLASGEVAVTGLFVAGMLLAGHAGGHDGCADGVVLATGQVAAEQALAAAGGST